MTHKPHAIGLDLSYTATGIAWPETVDHFTTPPDKPDPQRWAIIAGHAATHAREASLAIIEDVFVNHRNAQTSLRLARLQGAVIHWIGATTRCHTIVTAPKHLKRYATGNGAASKTDMLEAAQTELWRHGAATDHNEADALWLRAIGQHLLGDPICDLPDWRAEALDAIHWEKGPIDGR